LGCSLASRLYREAGNSRIPSFDRFAALERITDFVEEGLDQVFGFTLVKADMFE
jgi:hypothetical protein